MTERQIDTPAQDAPASVGVLDRLVDWTYLHATEGQVWPSTKTKSALIQRAMHDKPTQEHADGMKAAAPATRSPAATERLAPFTPGQNGAPVAWDCADEEYRKHAYQQMAVEIARLRAQVSEFEGYHHVAEAHIAQLEAQVESVAARRGIYIASKVKHADRWRFMRDKVGEPIISTWIDEAGEGETSDHHDLWRRCITEASSCQLLIVYREVGEILKGAWVELGCALTKGIPVYAVGLDEYTIAKYRGITHFATMKEAIAASRKLLRREHTSTVSGGDHG